MKNCGTGRLSGCGAETGGLVRRQRRARISMCSATIWPMRMPWPRRLLPYDIVCVMRERTPLRRELIERLPNLKLIASTGPRNASIDLTAAAAAASRWLTPAISAVRRSN